jgi:hypothetical protein
MFVLEGIGMAEYIARISYGKDSLKMLEVIHSRGLPLDRITTTDVWATDTISANLPPMDDFKARMDQRIWDMYHIEVEHLCARNKDGSKKTYEQMFYHVPVRRSQIGQVERERRFHPGSILGFPDILHPWCQAALKKVATPTTGQSRDSLEPSEPNGARNSRSSRINGFPAQISPWCHKLKIDKVKTPFPMSAAPQCAKIEMLWNTSESPLTSQSGSASSMPESVRPW